MIRDGDEIDDGATIGADLCIVGAGPAGMTIARELADHGVRIVLLESGGVGYTKSLREPWRVARQHLRGAQSLASGTLAGLPYTALRFSRARAFGGSTNALLGHGLQVRSLDPIDFEARDAVAGSGWPFGVEELVPYYARAEVSCGLIGAPYDADRWGAGAAATPIPLDPEELETVAFRAAPAHHFPGQVDEFRSIDGVEVVTNASVVELRPGANSNVDLVRVRTLSGRQFEVRASRFVLAAGALENARLLLTSKGSNPQGIGNEHDLVGRFFMEHPQVTVGLWDATEDARVSLPFYDWHQPAPDEAALRGHLRFSDHELRAAGLMNAAFELFPMRPSAASDGWRAFLRVRRAVKHKNLANGTWRSGVAMLRHAPDLVANVLPGNRRAERSVVVVEAMAEQEPNAESRVMLGDRLDRLGVPRTRLDWRLTARDLDSLRDSTARLGAAIEAAGLGSFRSVIERRDDHVPVLGNWHHMGTTRMHDDAREGVVNRDGRVHSVENLYIAGSSVFTTGGCSNPTLTLVALAHRLADHLRVTSPGS